MIHLAHGDSIRKHLGANTAITQRNEIVEVNTNTNTRGLNDGNGHIYMTPQDQMSSVPKRAAHAHIPSWKRWAQPKPYQPRLFTVNLFWLPVTGPIVYMNSGRFIRKTYASFVSFMERIQQRSLGLIPDSIYFVNDPPTSEDDFTDRWLCVAPHAPRHDVRFSTLLTMPSFTIHGTTWDPPEPLEEFDIQFVAGVPLYDSAPEFSASVSMVGNVLTCTISYDFLGGYTGTETLDLSEIFTHGATSGTCEALDGETQTIENISETPPDPIVCTIEDTHSACHSRAYDWDTMGLISTFNPSLAPLYRTYAKLPDYAFGAPV